jgi:hypothetical protein
VAVPALLPVGQFRFGIALGFGGIVLQLLQGFELRFAFGQRHAQRFDLLAIGGDVRGQLGVFALGIAMRALQAIGGFAVVAHLLFDARDLGADLVDLGLHRVQMLAGAGVALAHAFQLRLDLALAGELLLDFDFGGGQARAFAIVLTFRPRYSSARSSASLRVCSSFSASSARPRGPGD